MKHQKTKNKGTISRAVLRELFNLALESQDKRLVYASFTFLKRGAVDGTGGVDLFIEDYPTDEVFPAFQTFIGGGVYELQGRLYCGLSENPLKPNRISFNTTARDIDRSLGDEGLVREFVGMGYRVSCAELSNMVLGQEGYLDDKIGLRIATDGENKQAIVKVWNGDLITNITGIERYCNSHGLKLK